MATLPLLKLKPREGRRVRAGAPWVFANEIALDATAKSLAPGSLVRLEGDDGKSFGIGYFNLQSLIAVRLFECSAETRIDASFFEARLSQALALRTRLYERPFYRWVHAEGDGLPGLTVDRFGDTIAIQVTTAGMEARIAEIVAAITKLASPECIILRCDAPLRVLEGLETYVRAVKGDAPHHMTVEENGARYYADLAAGQKTGWYYDQRENRAFLAGLARGRSFLDAYCYTGGFAILAARAGAAEVAGIDSSAPALSLAQDAAAANGLQNCRFLKAEVFEELERLASRGERFDVVAADPPPFVKSRKDLEGLSQAGAAGVSGRRPGRHSVSRLVLAQHAGRPLRAGMRHRHSAQRTARRPHSSGGSRPRSSGPSLPSGNGLSEGAGVRARLRADRLQGRP